MKDGPMGGAIFLIAALDGESNNDASPNTCGAFDLLQENPYQEERMRIARSIASWIRRLTYLVTSTASDDSHENKRPHPNWRCLQTDGEG